MDGRGIHLCGSVPLDGPEAVFRQVSARLGRRVARIPDGETGIRDNWVVWQLAKLQAHPDLMTVPPPSPEYGPSERVRPRPGVDPRSIDLGPLGYAEAAVASWKVFDRLRADGVIDEGVRFQVSLPSPIAVIGAFTAGPQAELERRYEAALFAELEAIVAEVPARDLAIQWDAAVEFALFEGVFPSWFGSGYEQVLAGVTERLIRLGAAVPEGVELGYHLCYGDFGHRHFVEPADTSTLVAVANGIASGATRPVEWIHLPVPRNRADAEYFAPLADLRLAPSTTLYLGLVHAGDGFAGGRRRIEAARAVVRHFGIATECGFGRRPVEQIPQLLDLHARLADSLS
ncbi:hypothetical protein [Nocardia cyriacigeorgica]|uniref:hypothetical protein n=1 Tax=Nocardia cyriacigeorgica TaxID=135487 RepID=UPI0018951BB2|nr:hypothetical protein [Nocardia cyriacigeorgica]MBF6090320.1 hypothetical protein [Nocardia cyriacigeorgica]MBF6347070.1 hypothetical protein [Nocardia cyriacigeorgica]